MSKYDRRIIGKDGNETTVDVYDVLKAFSVTCPALQHLIEKALCAGLRGHKDVETDLMDIEVSARRAIELHRVNAPTRTTKVVLQSPFHPAFHVSRADLIEPENSLGIPPAESKNLKTLEERIAEAASTFKQACENREFAAQRGGLEYLRNDLFYLVARWESEE